MDDGNCSRAGQGLRWFSVGLSINTRGTQWERALLKPIHHKFTTPNESTYLSKTPKLQHPTSSCTCRVIVLYFG